jgi:FAD/FMN-containing dehydrogenase
VTWREREDLGSWGVPAPGPQYFAALSDPTAPLPLPQDGASVLPRGNARSYGDSCLNVGQAVLGTRGLDRFVRFDADAGLVECEAGVLLGDVLRLVAPHGWYLPVVPGTQEVTVGGAIANDVHGKNHHARGSFGCHVESLQLLRSDGTRHLLGGDREAPLFRATVGGLGLTGAIVTARLRLQRVPSEWMSVRSSRFEGLGEFEAVTREAESTHEHVVAWLDTCGPRAGRGILQQADFTPHDAPPPRRGSRSFPLRPSRSLVNATVVRAFNTLYFRRVPVRGSAAVLPAGHFMFPLDSVRHWNRMYGRQGFFQYQCVVPSAHAPAAMAEMLDRIARSGLSSFLAVLKRMGNLPSPGMLSFPREGWTLALDFPDGGAPMHALFAQLDALVLAAGGRLYPAKDARMPPALFRAGYPEWEAFAEHVDPRFSSSFWRRVAQA